MIGILLIGLLSGSFSLNYYMCPTLNTKRHSRRLLITTAISAPMVLLDRPKSSQATTVPSSPPPTTSSIIESSSKAAFRGGRAGATASIFQVFSLMWLRTAMNYEYKNGGDLKSSLSALYSEGGIPRFYQGLPFALVQGPLTKFGDTAANLLAITSIDLAMQQNPQLVVPLALKTLAGSLAAGFYRFIVLPVDTLKVTSQVDGKEGLARLWEDCREKGVRRLYQGGVVSALVVVVGHYPWFLTYNSLEGFLPMVDRDADLLGFLTRAAIMGVASSCVSDTCSNSLRVVKTIQQTDVEGRGAVEIAKEVFSLEGIVGFTRGLKTRILTNAIQGGAFSVLWKYFLV